MNITTLIDRIRNTHVIEVQSITILTKMVLMKNIERLRITEHDDN